MAALHSSELPQSGISYTTDGLEQTIKIDYVFPHLGPFIFVAKMDEELLKDFLHYGEKAREKNNDHRKKLAGLLRHEYYFDKEDVSALMPKINLYLSCYKQAFLNFGAVDDGSNLVLTDIWVNYMGPNEYNPPHIHSSDISFVAILDVPEELTKEATETVCSTGLVPGSLSFRWGEDAQYSINRITISEPEIGQIFIFPSHLEHHAVPFRSEVERITVSGNVKKYIVLDIDTAENKEA